MLRSCGFGAGLADTLLTSDLAQVLEACESRRLSEAGCEAVMQQVGVRFSEYQGSARALLASMTFAQAFSRLLGMRRKDSGGGDESQRGGLHVYDSFADAADAGYSSDSFVDIASWWRYQEMVGEAMVDVTDYARFADEPAFHFTCPYWTWGDPEATALAQHISPEDKSALFEVGDSHVGYREGQLPDKSNGDLPTTNTCRHTMQLSLLLKTLRQDGRRVRDISVVEIGGGYGNMARLMGRAYGFKTWTICDMPFMNRLQEYYLEQTLNAVVARNVVAARFFQSDGSGGGGERRSEEALLHCKGEEHNCERGVTDPELSVNLVDTRHLNIWVSRGLPKFDAVVATSSLSELDMDAFFWYDSCWHVLHTSCECLWRESERRMPQR